MSDWAGRRVTVMGLGLFGGGAGVARWLAEQGARVTVTDLRGAGELASSLESLADLDLRTVLGRHEETDFVEADWVVANPAVRPDAPLLARARERGVPVTTELALFFERCRARQIWISGTQGKSSTAQALATLLDRAGYRVHLAGNIGRSLLAELDGSAPDDIVVVEVSSYQLESLPANIAEQRAGSRVETVAITNVLADHLERHGSVRAYAAAKARLFEVLQPGGNAILPVGDARLARRAPRDCRRFEHGPPGASAADGAASRLVLRDGRFTFGGTDLGAIDALRLPGRFQASNVLVALGAAQLAGAAPERLAAALGELRGLPHRMEDLGVHAGRRIVDNGVSTTPDSTVAALDSVGAGCTLLVGGKAKRGLDFQELARLAARLATRVVTFGEGREVMAEDFRGADVPARACATLDEAVASALRETPRGETLLFSPAAASFDAYSNFRQRALAFRSALNRTEPGPVGADRETKKDEA